MFCDGVIVEKGIFCEFNVRKGFVVDLFKIVGYDGFGVLGLLSGDLSEIFIIIDFDIVMVDKIEIEEV